MPGGSNGTGPLIAVFGAADVDALRDALHDRWCDIETLTFADDVVSLHLWWDAKRSGRRIVAPDARLSVHGVTACTVDDPEQIRDYQLLDVEYIDGTLSLGGVPNLWIEMQASQDVAIRIERLPA